MSRGQQSLCTCLPSSRPAGLGGWCLLSLSTNMALLGYNCTGTGLISLTSWLAGHRCAACCECWCWEAVVGEAVSAPCPPALRLADHWASGCEYCCCCWMAAGRGRRLWASPSQLSAGQGTHWVAVGLGPLAASWKLPSREGGWGPQHRPAAWVLVWGRTGRELCLAGWGSLLAASPGHGGCCLGVLLALGCWAGGREGEQAPSLPRSAAAAWEADDGASLPSSPKGCVPLVVMSTGPSPSLSISGAADCWPGLITGAGLTSESLSPPLSTKCKLRPGVWRGLVQPGSPLSLVYLPGYRCHHLR